MNTVPTPLPPSVPSLPSLPIAITQGDPAGIGPELIIKAFRDAPDITRGCLVAGDLATLRRAADIVTAGGMVMPIAVLDTPQEALNCPPHCIPLWPLPVPQPASSWPLPFGQVNAWAGQMAGDCVVWATRAALRGVVSAVVTAPLNKAALAQAGGRLAQFAGHTELIQALAAEHLGVPVAQLPVRMMLANDDLRVVLVSIHLSLRDAIKAVTYDNVLQTLHITHNTLLQVLGRAPRIGVAGLNPHAGESGLFGSEELDIIAPAVAAAQRQGLQVFGPMPPDTAFMRGRAKISRSREFDVVVAMYHDQGLIPIKYMGVEQGVNVTLGLPLIRTSADHGTAFDIAGTGQADASSLLEAISVAKACLRQGLPCT